MSGHLYRVVVIIRILGFCCFFNILLFSSTKSKYKSQESFYFYFESAEKRPQVKHLPEFYVRSNSIVVPLPALTPTSIEKITSRCMSEVVGSYNSFQLTEYKPCLVIPQDFCNKIFLNLAGILRYPSQQLRRMKRGSILNILFVFFLIKYMQ